MVSMNKILILLLAITVLSCKSPDRTSRDTVTVSISPFGYFVSTIAENDFSINIMVPAGSDPHIYEPSPDQIASLRKSAAYISDGYLGFELTWLDRFFEANTKMKLLTLGDSTDIIMAKDHDGTGHPEGADPHFWVSPKSARPIAGAVLNLLCDLKPEMEARYNYNYRRLLDTIDSIDKKAEEMLTGFDNNYFMVFHPTLSYIARDYGLVQLAVEEEGKEPTPSSMKNLIDEAIKRNIKVIFVMEEFDRKNALTIASETGSVIRSINPLSEDWPDAVDEIITSLHSSLMSSNNK